MTTSGPRVLQLLGPSTGGIRRHVRYLTDHLRDTGWRVTVAAPAGVLDQVDHVVPIPVRDRPLGTFQARRALSEMLGDHDLVHAHGLKPGLLTASVGARPPMVLSVHNLVLDEVAGRIAPVLRRLEGWLPARAAATIAISDGVAARFAGVSGADRIRIIPPAGPPPVPTRSPEAVRRELGIGADDDFVVTPARLTPQKDIPLLLRAAERVAGSRPRLRWFVFGDGWLRDELVHDVERLGLQSIVQILPGRPDVDSELAAADAVVVTSRWESGPLVLLEAAELGRPMVSTDVGLARTVLGSRSRRVVPVGDADALAAALVETLTAGPNSHAGPPTAAAELRPPALAEDVARVYREVLDRAI
ncbi:MAG: glycosyltransferase family 4 protein [Acidimicrobiales bacterium]|nr:glycosyltransferase family 4 protein [Acidimicrobiales bacterium]